MNSVKTYLLCIYAIIFFLGIGVLSPTLASDAPSLFLSELMTRADHGDAQAQCDLGVLYWSGKRLPQDYSKAAAMYRKAADQGYPRAEYNLGYLYSQGVGVPKDLGQATKWIKKAAEQGYPKAQTMLGLYFRSGTGVSKDPVEAVKWFREAANQLDAGGEFYFGNAYFTGDGIPENRDKALKLYHASAEQGFMEAQYIWGLAIKDGMVGTPVDMIEAYMWVRLAALQGKEAAAHDLDAFEISMTPDQIEEAKQKAQNWKATLQKHQ